MTISGAGNGTSRGAMTAAVNNMEMVRQRTVGASTPQPMMRNAPAMAAAYTATGSPVAEVKTPAPAKYDKVV